MAQSVLDLILRSRKTGSGTDEAKKELSSFQKAAKGAKMTLGQMAVAAGTVTAGVLAMKKVIDLAEAGAELKRTKDKFDRLATSIDTTGDALETKLMRATGGLMSRFEALSSAQDVLSLGLVKNADDAVRLVSVMSQLDMDMNQVVLTLSNMTTMRFDQLNVGVDGFQERLDALKASGLSAEDAFVEGFLQQAEAQTKKVGSVAETTAGSWKILEAAMKDTKDEGLLLLDRVFGPLADRMADTITVQDRLKEAIALTGAELRQYHGQEAIFLDGQKVTRDEVFATADRISGLAAGYEEMARRARGVPSEVKTTVTADVENAIVALDSVLARLVLIQAGNRPITFGIGGYGSPGQQSEQIGLASEGNALGPDAKKLLGLVLPEFDTGGVVPGPVGKPQLVVAHGGEEITPPSGSTNRLGRTGQGSTSGMQFGPNYFNTPIDEEIVVRKVERALRRS